MHAFVQQSENGALVKGWQQGFACTQEFGTVGPVSVIKACARENAAWNHGADEIEAADAAQNVRDVFYVRTAAWQESVLSRGTKALHQFLFGLERPEDFPEIVAGS